MAEVVQRGARTIHKREDMSTGMDFSFKGQSHEIHLVNIADKWKVKPSCLLMSMNSNEFWSKFVDQRKSKIN